MHPLVEGFFLDSRRAINKCTQRVVNIIACTSNTTRVIGCPPTYLLYRCDVFARPNHMEFYNNATSKRGMPALPTVSITYLVTPEVNPPQAA